MIAQNVFKTTFEDYPSLGLIKQFNKLESYERISSFIGWSKPFEISEENIINTASIHDRIPRVTPKLWMSETTVAQDVAISVKKWEGVVVQVKIDSFIAELHDLATENDEETELKIDEISDEDRPLVKLGAVFYWAIGYSKTPTGQVKKESMIRFRRLPPWSESELTRAKKAAKEKLAYIVGK